MVEVAERGGRRDVPIRLSSASYPVSIGWKFDHPDASALLIVDGLSTPLENSGTVRILRQPLAIKLRLTDGSPARELPASYSLSQNYPNPFNPETHIEFSIPAPSPGGGSGGGTRLVSLKVYDILGKEVATLLNDARQPGVYRVTWNAADFPSGVYTYRLRSGPFTDVKKMLLAK
jgi:hypothetical protein